MRCSIFTWSSKNDHKGNDCTVFSPRKRANVGFYSKKYTILLLGFEVFFTFALIKLQRIDKMTTQRYFYSYFFYFTYRVKREVVR